MALFGSKKSKDDKGTKIKVRIVNIKSDKYKGDTYICTHVGSNFKVQAKCNKKDMGLEIGQIVMIEYDKRYSGGGYVVVDDLSEEMDAEVLYVDHIISEGNMYTSLIIRNPKTNRRMHSLVSNNNKLFSSSTCTIIPGDVIRLKINNGEIFKIHNYSEEAGIANSPEKTDNDSKE